jgi:hypothetical protein
MGRGEYSRIDVKNTTADYHSINITDLSRKNALAYGDHHLHWSNNGNITSSISLSVDCISITFKYSIKDPSGQPISVNKPIPLDITPCNYGGQRKWFICDCGRRVGRLFINRQQIACRHCLNLSYPSQRQDELFRARQRVSRLESKFNGQTFRPKGMHQKTYERLTERIINAEAEHEELFQRVCNERF